MFRKCCWSKFSTVVVCLALVSGCAHAVPAIEGKVTLDSKPLASGVIDFDPVVGSGQPLSGNIKDGNFNIEIPKNQGLGKCIVRIHSPQPTGRKILAGTPAPRGAMI